MVGLERVVDITVGVGGVEQRLITAVVNRGKFVKIYIYLIPYRTEQYRT